MQTPKSSQARAQYEAAGFYLFPEPVIDNAVIQRAVEGMDAVEQENTKRAHRRVRRLGTPETIQRSYVR